MLPGKRTPELQAVSNEHHDGLLLCRQIRKDLAKGVAPAHIRGYCRRFLKAWLKPHFILEEDVLFPILGLDRPEVRKALAEHRRLQRLINGRTRAEVAVSLVEEELEAHIRFEERVLLERIQERATPEQLAQVVKAHAALRPRGRAVLAEDFFGNA